MPASALDDDGSQGYDRYENSLSVHSQGYESALTVPMVLVEHQHPYESALPHAPSMVGHRRLSDHQQGYEAPQYQ
jgi:hypothetical protein